MSMLPESRTVLVRRQWSEFDLLLAAIPVLLVAGVVSAYLLSVPVFVGVAVGAGLACCLVGYGMYAVMRLSAPAVEAEPRFPRQPKRIN